MCIPALWKPLVLSVLVLLAACASALAQAGFDDDRVMLQGFYWESHRHGHADFPQFGPKKWYEIVRDNAHRLREARFDLVWLPPPSYAGGESAGYNPKELFRLDNSYGDFAQHRGMHTQDNAREKGVYAAMVAGRHGELYVRIGGGDHDWQPFFSGYRDYREYAYGAGWKVWVKLPGNPELRQAPLKPPFDVPEYRPADEIDVPDEWLDPLE